MSILFQNTIVHMLDLSLEMPVLSGGMTPLDDETESFLTKSITRLFEDHATSKVVFNHDSDILHIFTTDTMDFLDFSNHLARKFYNYMLNYSTIPSGDLIVSQLQKDGIPYIALLKLNYKEEFTHYTETDAVSGPVHSIIKHKSIFPGSSKIQEAALINVDTLEVTLLDQSKEKYMNLLLDCSSSLTVKEKIKVIEQVVTDAIVENFENKVEGISFAKNNLAESIATTSTIMIDKVLEETFGDFEEISSSCKQKLEAVGLVDDVIELPKPEAVGKKYTSHKLKTNTGIELKLPTQMLSDPQAIEFINNPDGTLSILIKNISELINK
ncbi:MAG: nucleoid-associated protein [Cellulosilyticaceae bacterium]